MNSKSLAQRTADEIYDLIFKERRFQPGEKLPNENELSVSLGISRATLREAIRMLALQGILEVRRGAGTFVTSEAALFDDCGIGSLEHIRIRLKDLYETRLLFEPPVTELACLRATGDELESICRQGRAVAEIIRAGGDRTEADQEFHRAIILASHNDFMIRLIPLINRAVSESIFVDARGAPPAGTDLLAEDTLRDHALIMDFLRKRDGRGARNAMEIHIHHAIHTLGLNRGRDPLFYPQPPSE